MLVQRFVSTLFLLIMWQASSAEALASDDRIPSKEEAKQSLLQYWEHTLEHDPDTKLFSKSSEPGVYNIETSAIPYKGRVKVLNLFVDAYAPVGDYDRQVAYGGWLKHT